jgi:hypothetical protein
MKCECDKYQKGMEALGMIAYNSHLHGLPYRGESFKFCPWCGGEVDPVHLTVTQNALNKINGLSKSDNMQFPR